MQNLPADFWTALLIGYGSIGIVFGLATIFSSSDYKSKSIIEIFTGVALAISTIALVFVTFYNLKEAKLLRVSNQKMLDENRKLTLETREMVDETRRIADITIEQFKIKSFPYLIVEIEDPYLENGYKYQKLKIANSGEITAFNVSCIAINVYKKEDGSLSFVYLNDATYEKFNRKYAASVINYSNRYIGLNIENHERKIPQDSSIVIAIRSKDEGLKSFRNLLYHIIIVKFKVPYDSKYTYETFSFYLKEKCLTNKKGFACNDFGWQPLDKNANKSLIEKYCSIVTNEKAKNFLSDFNR